MNPMLHNHLYNISYEDTFLVSQFNVQLNIQLHINSHKHCTKTFKSPIFSIVAYFWEKIYGLYLMSSFKLAPRMLFITHSKALSVYERVNITQKYLREERAIENREYVCTKNIVRLSHFLSVRYFSKQILSYLC